jgi:hypothetical protein
VDYSSGSFYRSDIALHSGKNSFEKILKNFEKVLTSLRKPDIIIYVADMKRLVARASSCACPCGCSSMVEFQPSKLATWVRFPSPAPIRVRRMFAPIAQLDRATAF